MMSNLNVSETITAQSIIDGVLVATYNAVVDKYTGNIKVMNTYIANPTEYSKSINRRELRQDSNDFEDKVYEVQDEILAELENTNTGEVTE